VIGGAKTASTRSFDHEDISGGHTDMIGGG
jgi:hypothetical protein